MKIVYTKDNCPACVALKQHYRNTDVEFTEVNIGKDISREEFIATYPTVRTVPYVVDNSDQ